MRRWVLPVVLLAVLATVAITALVLGAEVGESDPAASDSPQPSASAGASGASDARVTEAPQRALAPYYTQVLDWQPCEDAAECATLEVPVHYADPDGPTIRLSLLRVPAGGERVGSLVVNPGGPGAPGTDYAAAADQVFRQPLLDAFDIVGFDPRGTGDSSPVDCLSDADLDDYIATDPDPDTGAEASEYLAWTERMGAGCAANTGELIGHLSTVEAARDMDVLRGALGEDQLRYFGASYGTKLGATYAELFPDRVGRLVLDGAVDVSLSSRELTLQQAAGFETALRAFVENCVEESSACFLGDSVQSGLERISAFLQEVDRRPLPTGGDRELTEGNALYGIIAPLYNRDYWFLLSAALRAGLDGDGALLMRLSDLYTSRNPDGSYADNSTEALYAINCLDDPYALPGEQVAEQYADFEQASPTLGRVFAWMLTGCGGVQVESAEKAPQIRAEGAAPIVVVGTTRDPATPFLWASALADQLDSGVLIRRDGDGHTGYNAGNDCVDEAVERYLVEGVAPEDGLAC
jgi:pimeloyl-ACP methyl ester carboxylesterase